MSPRTEHLRFAAIAEIRVARDEVKAKLSEIRTLDEQLARVKQQLSSVQAAMAAMVPRSELIAAKEQIAEMDARMRAGEERQRRLGEELKEQALLYQSEIYNLSTAMQVCLCHAFTTDQVYIYMLHAMFFDGFTLVCAGHGFQARPTGRKVVDVTCH